LDHVAAYFAEGSFVEQFENALAGGQLALACWASIRSAPTLGDFLTHFLKLGDSALSFKLKAPAPLE
jgi:hypothetical protein